MTLDLAGPASRTARVFLSYKRNVEPDGALAKQVVQALGAAGHHVFIDQRLRSGRRGRRRSRSRSASRTS